MPNQESLVRAEWASMRPMSVWLWRLLASCAIVCAVALIIGDGLHAEPGGSFGVADRAIGPHAFLVTRVGRDGPAARAGLVAGDRVTVADRSSANRAALELPEPPAVGTRATLEVVRSDRPTRIVLVAEGARLSAATLLAEKLLVIAFCVVCLVFEVVAALIVVRRPERADARALATFFIALPIGIFARWPWYPPEVALALDVVRAALGPLAFAQLVRFALLFPQPSASGPRRVLGAIHPYVAGTLIVVSTAGNLATDAWDTYVDGRVGDALGWIVPAYFLVALAIAFGFGARLASGADRERLRWIALSTAIGIGGLAVSLVLQNFNVNELVRVPFNFLIVAIPIGATYAILRHRMLDVGFAINRALVFGTISGVVVAAFSLLEFVIGKYLTSLGHVQSAVLEALLALGIGVSLSRIHERTNAAIDTVFFRERHRAESALRRLASEAMYVDDPQMLGERVVAAVDRFAGASGSAIYLHDGNGAFAPLVTTLAGAAAVEKNDVAIVRMRASNEAVDLDDVVAESGASHCVGDVLFPMIVRGRVIGMLVCGRKRDLDAYAPDERANLADLARAAGIAFDTLATASLQEAVERALDSDAPLDELRRRFAVVARPFP